MPHYIAMWSGPRNISTAMMRAWENRPDTIVHDEPFYAHYLRYSPFKEDHPDPEAVIAAYENDWQKVIEQITRPLPAGIEIYYQKHMTHHMLPHITLDWLPQMQNAFLIREPRLVINSLAKIIPTPHIDQTGLPQQIRIFNRVRQQSGTIPPVIDARDVLGDPRATLQWLCERLDVPFDTHMLHWPAGPRDSDGNWGRYWYASVWQSTGFMPYTEPDEPVADHLQPLLAACQPLYDEMAQFRLAGG